MFTNHLSDRKSTFIKLLEKDNSISIHKWNLRFFAIEIFKLERGLAPALCKLMISQNRQNRHKLRINAYFTLQKMKFSIKNFFSKCDHIRSFLRIWSYLLKKSFMENFNFCAAYFTLRWVKLFLKDLENLSYLGLRGGGRGLFQRIQLCMLLELFTLWHFIFTRP